MKRINLGYYSLLFLATASIGIGQSIVGQQVHPLEKPIEYVTLRSLSGDPTKLDLVSQGRGDSADFYEKFGRYIDKDAAPYSVKSGTIQTSIDSVETKKWPKKSPLALGSYTVEEGMLTLLPTTTLQDKYGKKFVVTQPIELKYQKTIKRQLHVTNILAALLAGVGLVVGFLP